MRAIALCAAALCACGDDSSGTRDGGDGGDAFDAMIDADPNVRGTVTVRAVDKNDAPIAGMYVVFIDRDATVTELATDAAGMVQHDVYPNASVTAVRARGMTYSMTTIRALVPGDTITLISAAGMVPVSEDPFAQRSVPLPSADILPSPNGATKSGSTATFTTYAPHGLVAGDRVIVADVVVAGYNGAWTVASAPTPTTFTANLGAGGLTASGAGNRGATAAKGAAFTLTYPAYTGAAGYEVRTRCGNYEVGPATSAPLVLPVSCAQGTIDFEVFAKNSGGAVIAWTDLANVAFAANGNATVTDAWLAPTSFTATYTNPTALVTEIETQRYSPYLRGAPMATMMNSASSTTVNTLNVSQPARAVVATQLTCPSGGACLSTAGGVARQTVIEVVDGTAATYALDVGANLLPWVKGLYVPADTNIEVTVTGSEPYDIFEANLRFARGQFIYTWRVFGPIAETVDFPTLPATAPGDPTVQPGDIQSNYQVFVGESDAVSGYRDAIKNVYDALGTAESSPDPVNKLYGGTKNRLSRWN